MIEPLKPEDFLQATGPMEDYGIDYEDALHLTVATRKNAKGIISNDEDLLRQNTIKESILGLRNC